MSTLATQPANEWSAVTRWLVEQSGGKVKLAALLGVTRQTVAAWCEGESTPHGDNRIGLIAQYRIEKNRILATIPNEPKL